MAKVLFLHLFVILFTGGGGSASVHAGIPPPPGSRHPQPPRPDPPGADTHTPQSRHPPGADHPRKQTPAYGLRAAGTHPTGMHSCWIITLVLYLIYNRQMMYSKMYTRHPAVQRQVSTQTS